MRKGLLRKRRCYAAALGGRDGETVLADLERFCHARSTTHVPGDTHGSAQLEGRRQVWMRIQGFLRMTEDDINALADRAQMTEGD